MRGGVVRSGGQPAPARRLDQEVRDRAVEVVIDSGRDLPRWSGRPAAMRPSRAAVLAWFRTELTRPQPPRSTIRRPWRTVDSAGAGQCGGVPRGFWWN